MINVVKITESNRLTNKKPIIDDDMEEIFQGVKEKVEALMIMSSIFWMIFLLVLLIHIIFGLCFIRISLLLISYYWFFIQVCNLLTVYLQILKIMFELDHTTMLVLLILNFNFIKNVFCYCNTIFFYPCSK